MNENLALFLQLVSLLTLTPNFSTAVSDLSVNERGLPSVHIEIISVGNIHPTSISSLPYAAPAMAVGLEDLRRTFGETVTFKHSLLYDARYRYCNELTDNVDRLVAEYYYSRPSGRYNMTVFIAPGCTERVNFAKLVRGWNHLMMIGLVNLKLKRDQASFHSVGVLFFDLELLRFH